MSAAKLRLDAVDFFGLAEHYETSVCLLFKTFGGVPQEEDIQPIKKSTIYKPTVPLSANDIAATKTSEAADIQLYEYALQVLMDRLKLHNQPLVD